MFEMSPLARYFALLAVAWMIAMTWRLYPQFKDTIRVDGRLTTVEDYIGAVCGERVGPAAATCLAEAREDARRLLRREQGNSILLIIGPILLYLAIYVPAAAWLGRRRLAPDG